MAINIREANSSRPLRVMIYGTAGIGKSTLGAKADMPIFISPEGGNDQLKDAFGNQVKEISGIKTWDDLKAAVSFLLTTPHDFKTVVLDSADWIEKLSHAHILANPTKAGKSIITVDGGFNAGYRRAEEMHRELIGIISRLRDEKNMNVIVTAHAHVKQVKDPSMPEDYDQFCIKCHDMVSALWQEWVDALLFARFRTFVKTSEDEKARASGDGTRVIYTAAQPSFQAKNRYGLPGELEFTENFWSQLKAFVAKKSAPELAQLAMAEVFCSINEMLASWPDAELQTKIANSITEANNDESKIRAIHKRMLSIRGIKQ